MRALVFTTQVYSLGGAEGLSVELAQRLNRRGIVTDLLSMYSSRLAGAPEAADSIFGGVPSIRCLGLRVHPKMIDAAWAISRLRRLIIDGDYDIVETSLPIPTMLASWATLGLRTRVVAGLHALFERKLFNRPADRIWRLAVRVNTRVRFYGISHEVAQMWVKYSGTDPKRTSVIYNGIGEEFFEETGAQADVRRELGIPQDGRIALFVGRLVKSKGIDTVLEALAPFLQNRQLYLLYVGREHPNEGFFPDEHGLLERLQVRIVQHGWGDRVKFLGQRRDMPRLMGAADVLIHPARLEGFGLVLAEALACGLPVVASNVQGIPEVLAGTDSILLPPERPELFREAVSRILARSPEERNAAMVKGRIRAESFHMERRIDEMVELFAGTSVEKRRAA